LIWFIRTRFRNVQQTVFVGLHATRFVRHNLPPNRSVRKHRIQGIPVCCLITADWVVRLGSISPRVDFCSCPSLLVDELTRWSLASQIPCGLREASSFSDYGEQVPRYPEQRLFIQRPPVPCSVLDDPTRISLSSGWESRLTPAVHFALRLAQANVPP